MESEHTHLKPCFCRQRLDVLFVRLFGLSKLIVGLFRSAAHRSGQ